MKKFFLSCLNEDPELSFEDKLFESPINAIVEKLSSEIHDEEDRKYTKMRAVDFLICFKSKLPECIEIIIENTT